MKGTSAYAGPHYQKLYSRVTHARGDRRVQPTEVQWLASPWRNPLLDQAKPPCQVSMKINFLQSVGGSGVR